MVASFSSCLQPDCDIRYTGAGCHLLYNVVEETGSRGFGMRSRGSGAGSST